MRLKAFLEFDSVTDAQAAVVEWQDYDKITIGTGADKLIYDFEPTAPLAVDGVNVVAVTGGFLIRLTFGFKPLRIIEMTASGVVPDDADKVIVKNGATAITLTMPANSGRVSFSRAEGSTGKVTLNVQSSKTIQSLNGAVGATTTLTAHGAAGTGLRVEFWLLNNIWYR